MKPIDLRTEGLTDPLGLDVVRPRLSWRFASDEFGLHQVAYRIIAGDWDTGRVESDHNLVPYRGPALLPETRVEWSVELWDEHGHSAKSPTAFWETGLKDWTGKWIEGPLAGGPRTPIATPAFRRRFAVTDPASSRLYITALGTYVAFINGVRVGTQQLAPGWTDIRKRLRYQAYDISPLLKAGENVIVVELGDGWYCGNVEWRGRGLYGDRPRVRAQLCVDGQPLGSDANWQVGYGPRLQADLLMGEHVDARRAWEGWQPAKVNEAIDVNIVPQLSPPIEPLEPIAAKSINIRNQWPSPIAVFDLGQNMVGRVRIRLKGEPGKTVRLRYAEILTPEGDFYTANLRSAINTDYYTLKGDPEGECFEPEHTFHGFRYVEVLGAPGELKLEDLVGVPIHTAYEWAGEFECSDPLLNQLWQNIKWGWRGNSLDVPTDCPQRDERLGWTGDAQVFVRTAAFLADVKGFFEKYQQDLEDAQSPDGAIPPVAPNTDFGIGGDGGPAWADAVIICPWTIYKCTGDRTILERFYDSMVRFLEFEHSTSRDGIRCYEGYDKFKGFGDWLSINAETPYEIIGTAYYAYSSGLLAEIADLLGHKEDAKRFSKWSEEAKAGFQRAFVLPDGSVKSGTQTAQVLGLHFGLLEPEQHAGATRVLVEDIESRGGKLSTGFVGSSYLPHVLSEHRRADVALRLLFQKEWPSWLYAVTQGATTIWERWDGWTHDKGFQDVGMNSFNHYAYGAIGEWLTSVLVGIDIEEPGYKVIRFKPLPGGGLGYAKASHEGPFGRIEAGWTVAGDTMTYTVLIPPNSSGIVELPNGEIHEVEPGRHQFRSVVA